MGLKETFKGAAVTIVKAFGNVPKTCTYTQKGPQRYNETTGAITKTTITDRPKIIFDEFTQNEIGRSFDNKNTILSTDIKGLLPSDNLSNVTKPESGDKVTDPDGNVYTVLGHKGDPAEALFILLMRSI